MAFYKGLNRNPEIWDTPVWVLPNIWRVGRVRNATFGTNVSNMMLPNVWKYKGYSFYRFWIIKENQQRGKIAPKIRVKPNMQ